MKAAIWSLFALVATLWTGLVAASVELLGWAVAAVGSGRAGELASGAADWPVPDWLALWIDPFTLKALQASGVGLVQRLAEGSPSLSGVMDWLTPLMWMGWGLVTVLMLIAAGVLHWLVSRFQAPAAAQPLST